MKSERAYTLFEYVLIVPLLCMLVFGAFDLCTIWNAYAGLQQGVASGLRCLTTPDSSCYVQEDIDLYLFEHRTLAFEYRHPVYRYTAEEQWLEGPARTLSDFKATVLDSVSLRELGNEYQVVRPHYRADYVHWEEVQRAPRVSFLDGVSATKLRQPSFSSVEAARGVRRQRVQLDSDNRVQMIRVTTHDRVKGLAEAPCIRIWQSRYQPGNCDPRQVRIVLHVKGRAVGRGKVHLSMARISADKTRLKRNSKQWQTLGGQHYTAGVANFFPRGIPLVRTSGDDFAFLRGIKEEEMPTEFESSYNRLLTLQEQQALWIKIEWEEGHPWVLEGVEFYKSQYRYKKTTAAVVYDRGHLAPDPADVPLIHGIQPLLDHQSVRTVGEQEAETVCAYAPVDIEKKCRERYGSCRLIERTRGSCMPQERVTRTVHQCVDNFGVQEKEGSSKQHLLNICLPSESISDTNIDRHPIFHKKTIEFPDEVRFIKTSCQDSEFISKNALPEHLSSYQSLNWREDRQRVIHSTGTLPPELYQEERGMNCKEFNKQSRRITDYRLRDPHVAQLLSEETLQSQCNWKSAVNNALRSVRSVEDSYIKLSREVQSYIWLTEPVSLCSASDVRKRLRPITKWRLVPGGPFHSSQLPPFCAQKDIQCRMRKYRHNNHPQVQKEEALRKANVAAFHHSPLLRENCSAQECFNVQKLSNGYYRLRARVEVPLKSLLILRRFFSGKPTMSLSYQEENQHEQYIMF